MLLGRRNCLLWKDPSPLWASDAHMEDDVVVHSDVNLEG